MEEQHSASPSCEDAEVEVEGSSEVLAQHACPASSEGVSLETLADAWDSIIRGTIQHAVMAWTLTQAKSTTKAPTAKKGLCRFMTSRIYLRHRAEIQRREFLNRAGGRSASG